MMEKAIITAAGLGTRLLSVTKAQPKEMLPVFSRTGKGGLCMKPIVQLVFEDLCHVGFREFCLIVGRGQRTIQEHFTPDSSFISLLDKRGKNGVAEELEAFYEMVERSRLVWIHQPEPRGFGDAVLKAKSFIDGGSFLVHAGDSYFISKNREHLTRLLAIGNSSRVEAAFLVQEVDDPSRYGIVEGATQPEGTVYVTHVVEKPEDPKSSVAIMPVYVFRPSVFDALESTEVGFGGELQLTDGIDRLISQGHTVIGVDVNSQALRLDVGSPDSYWQAQLLSYKYSVGEWKSTETMETFPVPLPKSA